MGISGNPWEYHGSCHISHSIEDGPRNYTNQHEYLVALRVT